MYELIIQNYLKKLTSKDIKDFATLNNIDLDEKEVNYIYHTLKNNYKFLLGDDYMVVFEESKKYLSPSNYQKVLDLYLLYKIKYQDMFK